MSKWVYLRDTKEKSENKVLSENLSSYEFYGKVISLLSRWVNE